MVFEIYTKPHCPACRMTQRWLDDHGQAYTVHDGPAVAAKLRDEGWQQFPVVYVDKDGWSGYQPEKLREWSNVQEAN